MTRAWPRLGILIALSPLGGMATAAEEDAALFDAVWETVAESFYDSGLHGVDWPALRRIYRPLVLEADGEDEVRALLLEMLAELRASHTTILDESVHRAMMRELLDRPGPTFGTVLEESLPGRLFVRATYEGGPASEVGLVLGDRVVTIDGVPALESPALVDAGYDPGLPGPRLFFLDASGHDALRLTIQSTPDADDRRDVVVRTESMTAVDAARRSVRVVERDGVRVGTLHLWFCSRGVTDVLREAVRGPLADCDVLVLDVRGRGGFADVVGELLDVFRGEGGIVRRLRGRGRRPPEWDKPLVVLTDDRSRSAKELFAYRVRESGLGRLVGQRTEGAVLGAMFHRLPDGSVLELAGLAVPIDGVVLEGNGVPPHHEVDFVVPYAGGVDPIFEKGCEVAVELVAGERRRATGSF
ncbi:MAG: S41 family peptidase [Planctomycetota bacterium JB042]